jgi:hypothetical protein
MTGDPAPLSAFAVGLLVFAPGVTFVAALQVLATARADPDLTALAVILVVVINVLLVWLPITLHLVAPGRPKREQPAIRASRPGAKATMAGPACAAQLRRASSLKCGGEEGKHPQRVKQRAPAGAIV